MPPMSPYWRVGFAKAAFDGRPYGVSYLVFGASDLLAVMVGTEDMPDGWSWGLANRKYGWFLCAFWDRTLA